jgi:hypothetical protein
MITSQQLLNAITNELRIMKHLASRVTAENKDFRFTPAQRSTEELLQYIVSSFPAQIKLMVLGKRDEEIYMNYAKQFEGFTYTQFAAEIDTALVAITEEINSLSDAQRQEHMTIRGMEGPRTRFLND